VTTDAQPVPRGDEPPPKKDYPVSPRNEEPPPPPVKDIPRKDTSPVKDPLPVKESPPKPDEPKPAPKMEPTVPKADDAKPKSEEPAKPPKKEEPKVDERLKPLLTALKSNKPAERLDALEGLSKLGEGARSATAAICEVLAADTSPAVRQAALTVLEKVYPELHKSVVVLIVEADPLKNEKAAHELGTMGEGARSALAVVLTHIRTATNRFPETPSGSPVTGVIAEDLRALAQIAPDDTTAQKTIVDATRFTLSNRLGHDVGHPVRMAAVHALGDLIQKHPEQCKNLTPPLIAASRGMADPDVRAEAVKLLGTIADSNAEMRPAIASGLLALIRAGELRAVGQLGKCGRDAKDAVPLLKQLKLHQLEEVRNAAIESVTQIEDALASTNTPPKKDEPIPPKKDDPVPKSDTAPREDPMLPAEFRAVAAKLKSGTTEERVNAAEQLAGMGEKALPVARLLCEVALEPSQKVSRAALAALEKVHPDLHKSAFILVVNDEKAANHLKALADISTLGDQGKPALPLVLHEIKRCQELLTGQAARWGQETLVNVIIHSMETLSKISPEDPQAVKTIIELTKFSSSNAFASKNGRFATMTPFREDGLRLLGDIGEAQPEQRKLIVPALVVVLKEAVQTSNGQADRQILQGIEEVENAASALIRCGSEAKPVLTKEVMPRLKDLQFHKSGQVRATAEKLRAKIEDAP
jgi:hypothetical protein